MTAETIYQDLKTKLSAVVPDLNCSTKLSWPELINSNVKKMP
jgi:hypothetical protein